jgi:hypothetical protein
MSDDEKKFAILQHAREIYLTHLRERWALIHFMLIAYPAMLGGFGYIVVNANGNKEYGLLFFFVVLFFFITLIFHLLSERIGKLIGIQRDFVIKKIEEDLERSEMNTNKRINDDPGCYQPISREGFVLDNQEWFVKDEPKNDTWGIAKILGLFFGVMYVLSGIGLPYLLYLLWPRLYSVLQKICCKCPFNRGK